MQYEEPIYFYSHEEYNSSLRKSYNNIREKVKKESIPFNISFSDYKELRESPSCFFCAKTRVQIAVENFNKGKRCDLVPLSLVMVIKEQSYETENLRPCCNSCLISGRVKRYRDHITEKATLSNLSIC